MDAFLKHLGFILGLYKPTVIVKRKYFQQRETKAFEFEIFKYPVDFDFDWYK